MKKLSLGLIFTILFTFFNITTITNACTDFRLTAKDGSILITRSMEFALDFKSNLRTSNRQRMFTTTAPDGKSTISWKANYGYVYLDGLGIDFVSDGMNEKGLSFEALYLPGLTDYQTIPADHYNQALPYFNMGDWILSNFENVDQVRTEIQKIYLYAEKVAAAPDMIFPLHFSVYDTSGKGIVIEYIGGKLNIYDNQIGVLTNSPGYDWHLINLNNYVHLTPQNPSPVQESGITFMATGQGFGMIGMPGDISPPSRFVKIATLLRVALPGTDIQSTLNLAEHIINNVDIPYGLVREPNKGNFTSEFTQWVVFKDLTHKVFYYRTYNDLSLRAVSLSQINFAENAPRLKMPIVQQRIIPDLTAQFSKSIQ